MHRELVLEQSVIPEVLAVVGGHDDDRLVLETGISQCREDLTEQSVGCHHVAGVTGAHVPPVHEGVGMETGVVLVGPGDAHAAVAGHAGGRHGQIGRRRRVRQVGLEDIDEGQERPGRITRLEPVPEVRRRCGAALVVPRIAGRHPAEPADARFQLLLKILQDARGAIGKPGIAVESRRPVAGSAETLGKRR